MPPPPKPQEALCEKLRDDLDTEVDWDGEVPADQKQVKESF